jgi:hypothetical protein
MFVVFFADAVANSIMRIVAELSSFVLFCNDFFCVDRYRLFPFCHKVLVCSLRSVQFEKTVDRIKRVRARKTKKDIGPCGHIERFMQLKGRPGVS